MSWWWDWWLDFLWLRYILEWDQQMICHWRLNLVSHIYVKETITFGKTQNRFHCNGIWITDVFSQWSLKSVTACAIHIFLHILLLMMIRIFSGQLRNYLDLFFGWSMGTVWGTRGVRSMDGHSVQMLAWNVKFWAQRVKVLCPTFHSKSVSAHCSTQKSICWQKVLVRFMMTTLQLTVMFTQKAESFRVPCFFISC